MQTATTFDRLAQELSHGERREMLDRLRSTVSISEEPFFRDDELPGEVDAEMEYLSLGLWGKFLILLESIFSGTNRQETMERSLLRKLGRSLERRAPDIVDMRHEKLLPAFHDELLGLKEAADFLSPLLARILGKERQNFIAFLAGIELPEVQEQILRETEPEQAFEGRLERPEAELRRELLYRMETALGMIHEKERGVFYQDIRLLHALAALGRVPFGKLFGCFRRIEDADTTPCSLWEPKELLVELETALAGIRVPPTARLLEGLFIFTRQENGRDGTGEPDEVMEERLREQIRRAEDLFQKIRDFNRKVPLRDIVRYLKRDLNWVPPQTGGGEDWFVLYRQFLQQRIEARLHAYVTALRIEELERRTEEYAGECDDDTRLRAYDDDEIGYGVPARFRRSLSFLLRFARHIFIPAMNRYLKVLLIDGEFYKKENRSEFTDSYNGLLSLEGIIRRQDERFLPSGDIGTALEQIRREIIPPAIRQRKIRAVVSGGDREADRICSRAGEHLRLLQEVLHGILYGQVGGHFDTLVNLSAIGGKGNKAFLENLDEVMRRLEEAAEILGGLYEVELQA